MEIDDRFLKIVNENSMIDDGFPDAIEKSMIDFEIDHRFSKSLTMSEIVNDFDQIDDRFSKIVNDFSMIDASNFRDR